MIRGGVLNIKLGCWALAHLVSAFSQDAETDSEDLFPSGCKCTE